MTTTHSGMKMDFNTRRAAPGHPVKFLLHRSYHDLGSYYRNVADWQIDKSKSLYRKNLVAHFGCVNAIEFSKDGSMLVSGGDDRRVLLWNVSKALIDKDEPKVMQAEHLSNVFSLDFSCSSEKIISAGNDDQVIVHDIATGTPLDYFVHEQPVYGVSADPVNESVFCSACDDGRILIFDIRESENDPFCLAKLNSSFHSVMFHPKEPRLVVSANSKEGVASWDVRMPKKVLVKYGMQNSNQCCMSARFNRNGSQILVLRRRLPPILYSTDSPYHLYQFNHRGYYNSCTMKSCSFAGQDDQYVLSGSDNFDLHLWKIPTPGSDQWVNRADMVLRGHRSIVNQVRYNYVHNVIASSGVEKIIKLWSSFPLPEEGGAKCPTIVMNESERRIYTPDDYVSLVLQSGQGQFMSLTYEAGRKTTREDSRMLAFFDALVQRDINGLSDDDSDEFPETSYTNTVYSSPETSSSENEDEDSNPPNYRSLLSTSRSSDSVSTFSQRLSESISLSRINHNTSLLNQIEAAPNGHPNSFNEPEEVTDESEPLANSSSGIPGPSEIQPPTVNDENELDEINERFEERDVTANMITQLILEKEENRRKLLLRSKQANNASSNGHNNDVADPESGTNSSGDTNDESSTNNGLSTSRPLCLSQKRNKVKKRSRHSYAKSHNKFRKQLLRARRREMMSSTPVYDSSRNNPDSRGGAPAQEITLEQISELMTRNPYADESDSTLDSSSTSSSDSSSSDVDDGEEKSPPVIKKTKVSLSSVNTPLSRSLISTDSSDSDEVENDNNIIKTLALKKDSPTIEPSTSTAHSSKDLKRKWRPQCKLNEACKVFFKNYIGSESDLPRGNEEAEVVVPSKRVHLEKLATLPVKPTNTTSNVEPIIFKRTTKHKARTYRKTYANTDSNTSHTPPDSGIDVSKEPEPCCSSSVKDSRETSSLNNNTEIINSTNNKTDDEDNDDAVEQNIVNCTLEKDRFVIEENLDDPGFVGQVESDEESE